MYIGIWLLLCIICCQAENVDGETTTELIFLPTTQIYVRSKASTRLFLKHLKLDLTESVKLPVMYSIGSIKRFPLIMSNTSHDKKALNDLLTSRFHAPIIKEADGDCLPSTSGVSPLSQSFCIYSQAGYFFAANLLPPTPLGYITPYTINVYAKDNRSSVGRTTIHASTVPTCYPLDNYYQAVIDNCPTTITNVSHHVSPNSTIIKLNVGANFTLTNMQFINFPYNNGTFKLFIKLNGKVHLQRFGYQSNPLLFQPRQKHHSRIFGRKNLNLPLLNLLTTTKQNETIEVTLRDGNGKLYKVINVLFYGTYKIVRQPTELCKRNFIRWKDAYQKVMFKSRYVACATDTRMYYNQIRLQAYLMLSMNQTVYFGTPIKLYCEAFNMQLNDVIITWYKDNVVLATNVTMVTVQNNVLFDKGEFYCTATSSNIRIRSNIIEIIQDLIISTLEIYVAANDYEKSLKKYGEKMVLETIHKNTERTLRSNNYTFASRALKPIVTLSDSIVNITIVAQTYLNKSSTKLNFYKSLVFDQDIFSPYLTSQKTFKIFDSDACLPDTTGLYSSYGSFQWNITQSDTLARVLCNYGNNVATRECSKQNTNKVTWRVPDLTVCEYGSEKTKELKQILVSNPFVNITQNEVSNDIKDLTSNYSSLTTDDVTIVIQIFENITSDSLPNQINVDVWSNMISVADNLLQANKTTLQSTERNGNPLNSIITSLEQLTDNVVIFDNSSKVIQVSSANIAASIIKKDNTQPFNGISISAESSPKIAALFDVTENKLETSFNENQLETSFNENTTFSVNIPKTIYQDAKNISNNDAKINIVYFTEPTFFTTFDNSSANVASDIFSISVGGVAHLKLSENITWSLKVNKNTSSVVTSPLVHYKCVYWNIKPKALYGTWTTEGCVLTLVTNDVITCSCNHMTSFAVLFNPDFNDITTVEISEANMLAMTLITYIGCIVSIVCLGITVITLALFRSMRKNTPSQVLLGLCISLGLLMIVFLTLVDQTKPKWLCIVTSASIQYFALSTFCWMFFEAITLYLKVVKVMGEYGRCFVLKAWLFACGVPAIIVAIFLNLDIQSYGNEKYCMAHGDTFKYGLFTPICLMIMFNLVIFIKVVIALRKQNIQSQKFSHSFELKRQVRIAMSCCFLLGLTWIFGVLAISDARLPFQYLFCIFNSLQGLFLFYFNVFRQTRIRDAWKALLMKGKWMTDTSISGSSTFRTKTTSNISPNASKASLYPLPSRYHQYESGRDNHALDLDRMSYRSELNFSSFMERQYADSISSR